MELKVLKWDKSELVDRGVGIRPLLLLIRVRRKAGGKMSRREEYEQKAEAMLAPIVEANGFELVDVEYVKEA